MADAMKGYKEFLARTTNTESTDVLEGSGVVTNTLASGLLKKISALEKKIASSRKLETKIDLLAKQNTKLAGLDAIAIAVSGEAKGIFDRGTRLLSIIRAVTK